MGLCEERGIFVEHCLDYVREFKGPNDVNYRPDYPYLRMISYRPDYPYLKRNGGPCVTETDFLTLPPAKKQWKALQRYAMGRWGASTATFAWQLWNEMDCFEADHETMAAWTGEMARDFHANEWLIPTLKAN